MNILKDDWRFENGEHLSGLSFKFKKYTRTLTNDHDHCVFCWTKFMEDYPGCEHEGYASLDNYNWICKECFEDFKELLDLKLES